MTLETFIRAQLVAFAYQQVGETGSVNSLKAVCYVMTNRLKAGWSNDLLELIDQANEHSAHPPHLIMSEPPALKAGSASLQGLLRDIDDVFYASTEDETRKTVGKCLYWQNLLNKNTRPWFIENIVRSPEHPRKAQVGMIVLYE